MQACITRAHCCAASSAMKMPLKPTTLGCPWARTSAFTSSRSWVCCFKRLLSTAGCLNIFTTRLPPLDSLWTLREAGKTTALEPVPKDLGITVSESSKSERIAPAAESRSSPPCSRSGPLPTICRTQTCNSNVSSWGSSTRPPRKSWHAGATSSVVQSDSPLQTSGRTTEKRRFTSNPLENAGTFRVEPWMVTEGPSQSDAVLATESEPTGELRREGCFNSTASAAASPTSLPSLTCRGWSLNAQPVLRSSSWGCSGRDCGRLTMAMRWRRSTLTA
mmetsp:Transcript_19867/g.50825  ORF Transcript_19867/g.50825 Transcript_19867/m.50825 type:complete len:276 (-) Transcript_19867:40-867(-)